MGEPDLQPGQWVRHTSTTNVPDGSPGNRGVRYAPGEPYDGPTGIWRGDGGPTRILSVHDSPEDAVAAGWTTGVSLSRVCHDGTIGRRIEGPRRSRRYEPDPDYVLATALHCAYQHTPWLSQAQVAQLAATYAPRSTNKRLLALLAALTSASEGGASLRAM